MNKIVIGSFAILLSAFSLSQACQHLQPTSKPVPVVMMKDVNTGQEQDLMAEYKDNIKLVVFGNLADANFVADIKALNQLETPAKDALKRVIVVMDTKELETIKKFVADNKINIRIVIPAKDGWQKEWPGAVNRAVFIADQQNIVAQGVDVIGNENLIKETAAKLVPASS